jgi:hypothetical protein
MSEPLLIHCKEPASVPGFEELARQVTPQHDLVLELGYCEPWSEQLRSLAWRLHEQLPHLSVFVSGERSVALKWVPQEDAFRPHLDEFGRAVAQFTHTARTLVERLGSVLQISPAKFGEDWRMQVPAEQHSGCLDGRWDYFFHGREVQFQDLQTGSVLDVRLKHWGHPDALLDPFFVGMFLHSTPGFEALAHLLPDRYHDTARALLFLRKQR